VAEITLNKLRFLFCLFKFIVLQHPYVAAALQRRIFLFTCGAATSFASRWRGQRPSAAALGAAVEASAAPLENSAILCSRLGQG
jgi:hypothetical protein